MRDAGYKMQDAGYKMQDAGYKMRDAGYKMRDAGYKMRDESFEIKAFKASGKTESQVYSEASAVLKKFYIGGWLFGGFIGLAIALMIGGRMLPVYRADYVTNKGRCFSCARCVDYCPVKS